MQAIESDYAEQSFRERCLLALRKISGRCGELPYSHMILEGLQQTSSQPLMRGGFSEVYAGSYKNRQVAIKSIRIYHHDNMFEVKKVGFSISCLANVQLPLL